MFRKLFPFAATIITLCIASLMLSDLTQPIPASALAATLTPLLDWQITQSVIQESSTSPAFTMSISQPMLTSKSGKVDAFNAAVNKYISSARDDFKKSAADAVSGPANATSFLEIGYDVFTTHKGVVSVRFITNIYVAGAAHPGQVTYALNYDLNTGTILKLSDLFKPGTKYLQTIARYVTDELKRENRLVFPEGAQPTEQNYADWTIEHGGLLFNFGDYQVGPYAQGASQVFIPFTAIGDLLKQNIYFIA